MLTQAINSIDPAMKLLSAANGEEGLRLLGQLKEADQLPRLIVLDINMPRLDGKRTFKQLRSDPALALIPVVVFSTSSSALDKLFFQHQNVEYITKPLHFEHLVAVAKRLLVYLG